MTKPVHDKAITTALQPILTTIDRDIRFIHLQHLPHTLPHSQSHSGFFFYMLITKGNVQIHIDCHLHTFQQNDLVLIAPAMAFRFKKASVDFDAYGLYMEPSFFDSLQLGSYTYKQLFSSKYVTPVIHLQPAEMDSVEKTMQLMAGALSSCHAQEMMGHLVNFLTLRIVETLRNHDLQLTESVSRPDELFRRFRKLLALHYRTGHSISYYADRLNVSEAYLSRAVRKASGKTINHYITSTLVNKAKHDLIFKDSNIKEIALDLGFSDQSSFGKFFKKEVGLSPLMFRYCHEASRPTA